MFVVVCLASPRFYKISILYSSAGENFGLFPCDILLCVGNKNLKIKLECKAITMTEFPVGSR